MEKKGTGQDVVLPIGHRDIPVLSRQWDFGKLFENSRVFLWLNKKKRREQSSQPTNPSPIFPQFLSFPEIFGEGKGFDWWNFTLGDGREGVEPFLAHGIILKDIF